MVASQHIHDGIGLHNIMIVLQMLCFVLSENDALAEYARKASVRTKSAFRPRTVKCYHMLFKSFVAFCLYARVELSSISVSVALSYLEFLVENNISISMISNHIAAIKAMSIVYDIQYDVWDHPKIKYFVKSLKLQRPMVLPKRNIIDLVTLKKMIAFCNQFSDACVYRAVMLTEFFGFFRLSNMAPHSHREFDSTRHFTGGDVFFLEHEVKILLKWSKTIQYRDQFKLIVLPKLGDSAICPYQALQKIMHLYNPGQNAPLFQIKTAAGWQVLTDTRVRKNLAKINVAMNLPSNFYTFHAFRRSGASLAYELGIPVREIKEHGTWASECVWRYICPSASAGSQVSQVFRQTLSHV